MSRITGKWGVSVLCLLLLGCATAPKGPMVPAHEEVVTPGKVVYVIPKSVDIVGPAKGVIYPSRYYDEALKGLYFTMGGKSEHSSVGYGETKSESIVFNRDKEAGMIRCERRSTYTVGANAQWLAFTRYNVSVSSEERGDASIVTLIPKSIDRKSDSSLTVKLGAPKFPVEQLYDVLGKAHIRFKAEFDSPYNKDSTLANFRRLLGAEQKDREGNSFFRLKNAKYPTILTVEVWPYRDGSKAVVEIDTELSPTLTEASSRTIDVQKIVDEIRERVAAIVKS